MEGRNDKLQRCAGVSGISCQGCRNFTRFYSLWGQWHPCRKTCQVQFRTKMKKMVYHFCTSQGWRAGPALASSVRLQRWGGAEEEENERRCHRTEKKTHKNLVFSSDLSFDMDTCSATELWKRPPKILFFIQSGFWLGFWILAMPQSCEKDSQKSCFFIQPEFWHGCLQCHKTTKKTLKIVFFYLSWVLTWILAVPPADTMSLWSEEECRAFETGLRFENI